LGLVPPETFTGEWQLERSADFFSQPCVVEKDQRVSGVEQDRTQAGPGAK
jgi:hypothetical protein